ncbi:MAG TPA: MBL fold metallo-hydrolase [Pirellulaceae bacterium]|nr:MBL fold metallo-hydrolase [Pirellulaceae bacterium]
MILKQYYLACLAHASYLIADEKTKEAVIVDPQRDIDQYLSDAQAQGLTIKHVFLTHFHADFLAGHIELRNRTGAKIHLGRRAQAEYDFVQAKEGDVIEFGEVKLKILETPGHTPEGISILVYDLAKSKDKPHAVLTGDTLFIGDVGRPDLLASLGVTADELADMLYDSVTNKLAKLPDETLVYPAHGAGSMCGKNLSKETVSTIGEQKKFNYALQPMSREQFKAIVTEEQPEAPQYFAYDAVRNRQERPALEESMTKALRALPLDEVLRMKNQGAQLLDVREGMEFEGAHLAGSLNIALLGKYATWCGTMLDREAPIVVIAEPGGEDEAVMRLGRIGFDNVAGYLAGGMAALENYPELVETTDRVTAQALARLRGEADAPLVLDVRSEKEWESGHIAGSVNIPLNHLRERIDEMPADRQIAVHCEGGYRSAIAASVLAQEGRKKVFDLVGGYKAWVASSLPTEAASPVASGA